MPVAQVARLSKLWEHGKLAPDWQPPTLDDRRASLAEVGLTGPFWELPGG